MPGRPAEDGGGVGRLTAMGTLREWAPSTYKTADVAVRTDGDDIHVPLGLKGREIFGIFAPRVKEMNVRDMPIGFLAKRFPGL